MNNLYHEGYDISQLGIYEVEDPAATKPAPNCPKCNAKRLYADDECIVCGYEPEGVDYLVEPDVDEQEEMVEAMEALYEEFNE
jgi:hypothetical protein